MHNACPDVTRLYTLSGIIVLTLSKIVLFFLQYASGIEDHENSELMYFLVQNRQYLAFLFMSSSFLTGDTALLSHDNERNDISK